MNNKVFIALVVLAAGVLVGWYFLKGSTTTAPTGQTTEATPTPSGSNLGAPEGVSGSGASGVDKGGVASRTVVTYSNAGFTPASVKVSAGTVVTFVNESTGVMWVASDPHPIHSLLPGFDQRTSVGKGGTYEYTFAKVGTWSYHNHMNTSSKGTVVVQ